jgi:hypothetical protein
MKPVKIVLKGGRRQERVIEGVNMIKVYYMRV